MRKGWDNLSPGYRQRLESKGIGQSAYDAGQSLQKARGHGETPENPRSYDPTKYQKYHTERTRLERELAERKAEIFAGTPRWNASQSADEIRKYPPTLSQLRWAVNEATDEELEDAAREIWGTGE